MTSQRRRLEPDYSSYYSCYSHYSPRQQSKPQIAAKEVKAKHQREDLELDWQDSAQAPNPPQTNQSELQVEETRQDHSIANAVVKVVAEVRMALGSELVAVAAVKATVVAAVAVVAKELGVVAVVVAEEQLWRQQRCYRSRRTDPNHFSAVTEAVQSAGFEVVTSAVAVRAARELAAAIAADIASGGVVGFGGDLTEAFVAG